MKSAFNPFEMAQSQFDKSADILGLDGATRDLLRWPLREFHFAHSGAHGRREHEGVPRLPRPAQRRPRPVQGRDPVPPAGDDRHRARPVDVDDVEVLGRGHPAGRGEGRRHLRSAQPERARAGADLPGLDPADLAERRPQRGRAGARRDDDAPAHALDARRVRGDPRRPGAGFHHRKTGRDGGLSRSDRGHGLRPRLRAARGAPAARPESRQDRWPACRASGTWRSTPSGST